MTDENKFNANVSIKDAIVAFVAAAILLVVFWYFEKNETWAEIIILVVVLSIIIGHLKKPKEQRKKLRLEFMEEVNRSRAGRMMKYFIYSVFVIFAYTVINKFIL